jgi:hypothetical protein
VSRLKNNCYAFPSRWIGTNKDSANATHTLWIAISVAKNKCRYLQMGRESRILEILKWENEILADDVVILVAKNLGKSNIPFFLCQQFILGSRTKRDL